MRFTRKTIMALSVSGALTLAAGVSASAAVLDLPILGFGEAASEQVAPKVVHQTVYDDHYVTATTMPRAATHQPDATGALSSTIPGTTSTAGPASTAAPAAVGAAAPAAPAAVAPVVPATPVAAPAVPATPHESDGPPVTTVPGASIPPPPAGCREPEWDREHKVWQCSGSEGRDD
jgi:hypothetical protein